MSVRCEDSHLSVIQVDDLPGMPDHGRDVGGGEHLALAVLADSDEQR